MRLRLQNLHSTMLLLYQHVIPVLYCVNHHLHSTMLLLYPAEKRDVILIRFHLHSTMLLLYPGRSGHARLPLSFTFHYASTLSISGEIPTRQCLLFTFHYASTLSMTELFKPVDEIRIYIPLCFYFILKDLLNLSDDENLHSTMLLLYPGQIRRIRWRGPIYIPLCFYFIKMSDSVYALPILIYIPLCFYFIQTRTKHNLF